MRSLSPGELRGLSVDELRLLAEDIRQAILSACLKNGGHLGASLGAVEIAIALHRVFESPQEPLIWDVGHQAYAHKLITGRWDRFMTLREAGGISGFLSREESEHDVFGAGHSSTGISAALAMAVARRGTAKWSVAIVGDGGLTAGLAFEALNNARATETGPLLVVLNDNQMSISPNVGAVPAILAGNRVSEFFELLGFSYVGPVDGHDLHALLSTLEEIKRGPTDRPVILHALTQKGKGYAPAEESPSTFHGIGPVKEKVSGRDQVVQKQNSYSQAFGEAMLEIAVQDPRVVAISAAMPEGTGLSEFGHRYPSRFFDVGIAEPHAVVFAAGLATQGFRPIVAVYSTFLQRGFDALIHDVALQNLPVVFALDRAGLVGADGPTHHGMFDLAYLSMIPNMTVTAPSCLSDVSMLLRAGLAQQGPFAIRYPRGGGLTDLPVAEAKGMRRHFIRENPKLMVVALGTMASRAASAASSLAEDISLWSTTRVKPISTELIHELRQHPQTPLLVIESGVIRGGFGEALLAALGPRNACTELAGYGDHFVTHGSPEYLDGLEGLSEAKLQVRMKALIES